MNPEAKIIIMLRNPVEMLYAYHSQLLFGVCEDIEDFEQALEAEPDRRRGERMPPYCMIKESLYYSDVAKYAEQVQRYLETFGREQVLVILFDDFKADARRVFRRTLEFLGVDPDFEASVEVINPNTTRRSARLQAFAWQPPRVVDALLRTLPDSLRIAFLKGIIRINTKVVPREKLSPVLREQLCVRLTPEVEGLGKLLGRDLWRWLKP